MEACTKGPGMPKPIGAQMMSPGILDGGHGAAAFNVICVSRTPLLSSRFQSLFEWFSAISLLLPLGMGMLILWHVHGCTIVCACMCTKGCSISPPHFLEKWPLTEPGACYFATRFWLASEKNLDCPCSWSHPSGDLNLGPPVRVSSTLIPWDTSLPRESF